MPGYQLHELLINRRQWRKRTVIEQRTMKPRSGEPSAKAIASVPVTNRMVTCTGSSLVSGNVFSKRVSNALAARTIRALSACPSDRHRPADHRQRSQSAQWASCPEHLLFSCLCNTRTVMSAARNGAGCKQCSSQRAQTKEPGKSRGRLDTRCPTTIDAIIRHVIKHNQREDECKPPTATTVSKPRALNTHERIDEDQFDWSSTFSALNMQKHTSRAHTTATAMQEDSVL